MDSNERDVLIFIKSETMVSTSSLLDLLRLRTPKGQIGMFCMINAEILELQKVDPHQFGSWFINQRVSSSKHFFLASKIDPRFLLLPYIQKNGQRYSPIDQLITSETDCNRIPVENIRNWKLEDMCDVNAKFEDLVLYRHNEEKLLNWLKLKVESTARVLKHQRLKKVASSTTLVSSKFNMTGQSSRVSAATESVDVVEDDAGFLIILILQSLSAYPMISCHLYCMCCVSRMFC